MRNRTCRASLVAVALLATSAYAKPDEEALREAGKRFRAGDQAYKLGDYAEAIAAFEDAFRLSEDPIVLFNIAQSYRKQFGIDGQRTRLVKARDLYRTFLREVSDPGLRTQAEGLLAEVEKLLAETKDSPAPVPAPVPATPRPAPAAPPPLPPAAQPEPQPAAVSPEAEVTATAGPEGRTPWYKSTWVWVAAGVVAAGAGAGVYLATSGTTEEPFCPGGCPTASVPTTQQ